MLLRGLRKRLQDAPPDPRERILGVRGARHNPPTTGSLRWTRPQHAGSGSGRSTWNPGPNGSHRRWPFNVTDVALAAMTPPSAYCTGMPLPTMTQLVELVVPRADTNVFSNRHVL